MPSRQETLDAYVAAWNTTDAAECRRLLERSWADTATYTDPTTHLQGRDALVAHCTGLAIRRAGARVVITGDVDSHHQVARFPFAVVGVDGSRLRSGIDFAEFGPEGELTRIVGFFDA
jgi:hypothetical protein